MVQIDIARMSSKGQIVIPQEIREGIREGDKVIVIRNKDQIILKKADKFDKNLEEDLEFARRTEEAWREIRKGKGITRTKEEFLEEIKGW